MGVSEDEPDPTAPIECPRCHNDNPHDVDFCVFCDQALSHEAVDTIESATPTPSGGTAGGAAGFQPTDYRYETLISRAKDLAQQARQFESEFLRAIGRYSSATGTNNGSRTPLLARSGRR